MRPKNLTCGDRDGKNLVQIFSCLSTSGVFGLFLVISCCFFGVWGNNSYSSYEFLNEEKWKDLCVIFISRHACKAEIKEALRVKLMERGVLPSSTSAEVEKVLLLLGMILANITLAVNY